MNKVILSTIAGVMLSTTALATPLTDFFYANGYTQPDSIVKIQSLVDDGTYYNYPYVVGGGVEKGLFKDKLKDGTVIPQIKNVASLKAALDKKQVVLVASKGAVHACLPIFAEIAKQNGVSCTDLMGHFVANELDGEDFFTNLDDILATVDAKISEIQSELNDEVSEEVSKEVANEITEQVSKATQDAIQSEVDEVANALAALQEEFGSDFDGARDSIEGQYDNIAEELNDALDSVVEEVTSSVSADVEAAVQAFIEDSIDLGHGLGNFQDGLENQYFDAVDQAAAREFYDATISTHPLSGNPGTDE